MKTIQSLILLLVVATPVTNAIVIRHDIPDKKYHAALSDFPPLTTLYNIGVHGTLIHPEWVVTAAHTLFCLNPGQKIRVGDEIVTIADSYGHPEYQLGDEHDIALVRLSSSITKMQPAEIYRDYDEEGQVTWFIGVGGTGTGLKGETVSYKENKGQLRKAQNKIVGVNQTDIIFKFEKGSKGEELEGVSGNGDSGGPAYVRHGNTYKLLGISSRADSWFYDIGEYGVTELYTRVSSYQGWIDQLIAARSEEKRIEISSQDKFLHDGMEAEKMKELCSSIEIK